MLQLIQIDFWIFPHGPDFLLKSLLKLEGVISESGTFFTQMRGHGFLVQPSKNFKLRKINPVLMIS